MSFGRWNGNTTPNELPDFGMLLVGNVGQVLAPALRQKQIERRDVGLLLALTAHLNPRTGRTDGLTLRALAEEIGAPEADTYCGFARLRRAGLVARGRRRGARIPFLMASPDLLIFGGPGTRERIREEFWQATATG